MNPASQSTDHTAMSICLLSQRLFELAEFPEKTSRSLTRFCGFFTVISARPHRTNVFCFSACHFLLFNPLSTRFYLRQTWIFHRHLFKIISTKTRLFMRIFSFYQRDRFSRSIFISCAQVKAEVGLEGRKDETSGGYGQCKHENTKDSSRKTVSCAFPTEGFSLNFHSQFRFESVNKRNSNTSHRSGEWKIARIIFIVS